MARWVCNCLFKIWRPQRTVSVFIWNALNQSISTFNPASATQNPFANCEWSPLTGTKSPRHIHRQHGSESQRSQSTGSIFEHQKILAVTVSLDQNKDGGISLPSDRFLHHSGTAWQRKFIMCERRCGLSTVWACGPVKFFPFVFLFFGILWYNMTQRIHTVNKWAIFRLKRQHWYTRHFEVSTVTYRINCGRVFCNSLSFPAARKAGVRQCFWCGRYISRPENHLVLFPRYEFVGSKYIIKILPSFENKITGVHISCVPLLPCRWLLP